MKKDSMAHVRSGGREIELYAELGDYFSSDGHLREEAFRAFISNALQERSIGDDAQEWLSAYLDTVLTYLDEKGMGAATLPLFEIAIDESAGLGIDEVSVSPKHVRRMLSQRNTAAEIEPTREQDGDGKHARILHAALDIFTNRGFHESTIDEIAAASGVAKGTVYRYFSSKDDLLEQLLQLTSAKIAEQFAHVFSAETDVLEQIKSFVGEWVAFIEENHALYRLIQAQASSLREGDQTVFYEILISQFPMTKERVVSMNRGGELKTTSFHTVAYGTLGFIDGVAHKWFRSGMDYPLRDEIPIILEVLFNGFVGDHGRSESASDARDEASATPALN
ncbi:MAG TPA: TetR/AcrR family transcriptional regulator [Candidatus Hydrogenedentes bacterium]|nr:TetR/AcrR family transcriptional regulator [Candidatus Hydrogenedentota bacterium]